MLTRRQPAAVWIERRKHSTTLSLCYCLTYRGVRRSRLLVAAGIPVKVVSERPGHAHPSFTIHTYQHLLPGMSAEAAHRFGDLIKPVDDAHRQSTAKRQLNGHAGGE